MPAQWYIRTNGGKSGPYSPKQLKHIAAKGKIDRETLVRRGPSSKWVRAAAVRGLLQSERKRPSTAIEDNVLDWVGSVDSAPAEIVNAEAVDKATRLKTGTYTLSGVVRNEPWQSTQSYADLQQHLRNLEVFVLRAKRDYTRQQRLFVGSVIASALLVLVGVLVFDLEGATVTLVAGLVLFVWGIFQHPSLPYLKELESQAHDLKAHCECGTFHEYVEYKADILGVFLERTRRGGEVGRAAELSGHVTVFYIPSFVAFLNFDHDSLIVVETMHIRDAQITTREIETTSTTVGITSGKTGSSLTGAAIGGLVFGMEGAIAGAVIGSSGEREMAEHTVHSSKYTTSVDLYTRLKEFPVLTVCFGEDEASAKEFFGVMSASIETPSQNAAGRLPEPSKTKSCRV